MLPSCQFSRLKKKKSPAMARFPGIVLKQWVALVLCILMITPASLSDEVGKSGNSFDDAVSSDLWFINDTVRALVEPIHPSTVLVSIENGDVQAWGKFSALWSFSSGPPLVSFRSFPRENPVEAMDEVEWFVESPEVSVEEDGTISVQDSLNRTKTLKLTLKDLRQGLVHVRTGEIIKVDRHSTVFLVDADTGKIIRELGSHTTQDLNFEQEKKSLFVIRTDYIAKATNLSGNSLWTLSYGEIGTLVTGLQTRSQDMASLALLPRMSAPGVPYKIAPPMTEDAVLSQTNQEARYLEDENSAQRRALPAAGQAPQSIPSQAVAQPSISLPNPGLAIWEEEMVGIRPYNHAPGMVGAPEPETRPVSKPLIFTILVGLAMVVAIVNWSKMSSVWEKAKVGWLFNRFSLPTKASTSPPKRRKGRKSPPNHQEILSATPPNTLSPMNGAVVRSPSNYGSGTQVGRLFVTNTLIGSGSHGTLVLEGYLEGRKVAVKRLLAQYYEKAQKEIALLIASDEHPNVVRYYATEATTDFVYVSLERCSFSLYDLILSQTPQEPGTERQVKECLASKGLKMRSVEDFKLWDERCRPSAQLFQIMRDVVAGLAHLHAVGIVHRDLKPQNVLISSGRIMQAKIADMGLSKQLDDDAMSFDTQLTGHYSSGSRGWQAPEQLLRGRGSRAVDIFSLGCVLYHCITAGKHPFGSHLERDGNIVYGKMDLFHIIDLPEAFDLIQRLLDPDPSKRPPAQDILQHPFFWDSEKSLTFLKDVSDRVELDMKDANSALLADIESIDPSVICGDWDAKLDYGLLQNIRGYRRYNFKSIRDLLRVIRNKANHFGELPEHLREILGPVPDGLDYYFRSRFPRLLIELYQVIRNHCRGEFCFEKYYALSYSPKFPISEPGD